MALFYRLLERVTPQAIKKLIPERWRIWLGYQVKVKYRNRLRLRVDTRVDFLQHTLTLPTGETEKSLHDYLAAYYIDSEGPTTERKEYLNHAFRRFLYTLQIIPKGSGRLLEIGAAPYYTSLLLHRFTDYTLSYTNYSGPDAPAIDRQRMVTGQGESVDFEYHNVDIQTDSLNFPNGYFDVILFCEVLEHLTNDPMQALLRIKQALAPGGYLVLTTPNAVRWQNVSHMIGGGNVFDNYSAYGPFGRHNREYTPTELKALLEHLGFTIEEFFTSDVDDAHKDDAHQYMHLLESRQDELGEYMFVRAKNSKDAKSEKPHWLYRSYPAEEMV